MIERSINSCLTFISRVPKSKPLEFSPSSTNADFTFSNVLWSVYSTLNLPNDVFSLLLNLVIAPKLNVNFYRCFWTYNCASLLSQLFLFNLSRISKSYRNFQTPIKKLMRRLWKTRACFVYPLILLSILIIQCLSLICLSRTLYLQLRKLLN